VVKILQKESLKLVDNIKKFKTFVFGVTEEEEKIGVKYI
jgi:hypothetical protein